MRARRIDDLDLFAPDIAVFACVRVQTAERDAWRLDAEVAPQRFADHAADVHRCARASIAPRQKPAGVWIVANATLSDGPASIITGPRAWLATGHVLGEVRQKFGVSRKAEVGGVQHSLGDGQRHERRRRAFATAATLFSIAAMVASALTGSGAPGVSSIASGADKTRKAIALCAQSCPRSRRR